MTYAPDERRPPKAPIDFLFDVKLAASIRVTAATEALARYWLGEHLSCADTNFGSWIEGPRIGEPILAEASIEGDAMLVEVDGESATVDFNRDSTEDLGEMIRTPHELYEARKALGWTIAEMARELRLGGAGDKPAQYVREMESGARPISGPISVAVEAFLAGFRPDE